MNHETTFEGGGDQVDIPQTACRTCEDRVLDGPASGGKGSKGRNFIGEESQFKVLGNEVYYTASSLKVIVKYSCSRRHCQKVLN